MQSTCSLLNTHQNCPKTQGHKSPHDRCTHAGTALCIYPERKFPANRHKFAAQRISGTLSHGRHYQVLALYHSQQPHLLQPPQSFHFLCAPWQQILWILQRNYCEMNTATSQSVEFTKIYFILNYFLFTKLCAQQNSIVLKMIHTQYIVWNNKRTLKGTRKYVLCHHFFSLCTAR